MPIYEFSCPRCRVIFSLFSKRVNPDYLPACPKCGSRKMEKELSQFAMIKGGARDRNATEAGPEAGGHGPMPDLDDPKMMRAMADIERDMDRLDENNPKHMAHLMRKMKDALPPGTMPNELDTAIKRLEKGEDPEKIEADMGDVLGEDFGPGEEDDGGGFAGPASYRRDNSLYDYQ